MHHISYTIHIAKAELTERRAEAEEPLWRQQRRQRVARRLKAASKTPANVASIDVSLKGMCMYGKNSAAPAPASPSAQAIAREDEGLPKKNE